MKYALALIIALVATGSFANKMDYDSIDGSPEERADKMDYDSIDGAPEERERS